MGKKLPAVVMKFLREIAARGGKVGGARAAANMTAEQRRARAVKAAEARWSRRRKS